MKVRVSYLLLTLGRKLDSGSPQGMSEVTQEEASIDPNTLLDEHDVDQIKECIQGAQYYDASSMAPLTPASLVSITSRFVLTI